MPLKTDRKIWKFRGGKKRSVFGVDLTGTATSVPVKCNLGSIRKYLELRRDPVCRNREKSLKRLEGCLERSYAAIFPGRSIFEVESIVLDFGFFVLLFLNYLSLFRRITINHALREIVGGRKYLLTSDVRPWTGWRKKCP